MYSGAAPFRNERKQENLEKKGYEKCLPRAVVIFTYLHGEIEISVHGNDSDDLGEECPGFSDCAPPKIVAKQIFN